MSLLEAVLGPLTSDRLLVEMLWQIGIFLLIAISLDLVMGFGGMFQLGHIGFFALGAIGTTFGTKTEYLGLDLFGGILFGMLLTTAAVMLIGIPTLRLRGDYFAIATFGFTLSTQAVMLGLWATGVFNVPSMNPLGCDTRCLADTAVGGWLGQTTATLLGVGSLPSAPQAGVELLLLGSFVVACYVLLGRLKHSPLGRTLKSIREDHRAAQSLGKDVQMLRFKALWISAVVQSLAGSLWVHHVGNLGPNFYGFQFLILTVIAVILGGLGSHFGAMLGAILFVLINEESKALTGWAGQQWPVLADEFSLASLRFILFGILLVAMMLMRPQGIMGERQVTLRDLARSAFTWVGRGPGGGAAASGSAIGGRDEGGAGDDTARGDRTGDGAGRDAPPPGDRSGDGAGRGGAGDGLRGGAGRGSGPPKGQDDRSHGGEGRP